VVNHDVLFHFRLRLFSLAEELGNLRQACRTFGVHPSTYYRWRGPVLRSGLEMLRPRERRPPRMPNQTSQLTEQRVVAFSLGHPGLGPRRISYAVLISHLWSLTPSRFRHRLTNKDHRGPPRGRRTGLSTARCPALDAVLPRHQRRFGAQAIAFSLARSGGSVTLKRSRAALMCASMACAAASGSPRRISWNTARCSS
jgi:hypothetical protein